MPREKPFTKIAEGIKALKVSRVFASNDRTGIAKDEDGNATIPVTKHYFTL